MIPEQRLKEIEQLAETATAGPWSVRAGPDGFPHSPDEKYSGQVRVCGNPTNVRVAGIDNAWWPDINLMVASRDVIPELLAEIRRLKRGEFTPEEFQALCHHRDEQPGCTRADFEAGCQEYQKSLFGAAGGGTVDAFNPDCSLTEAGRRAIREQFGLDAK
jgi:hypothetical protein